MNVGGILGAKMLQKGRQESSRRLLKSKSYFTCVLGGLGGGSGWRGLRPAFEAVWGNNMFHAPVSIPSSVLVLSQNVAADVPRNSQFH